MSIATHQPEVSAPPRAKTGLAGKDAAHPGASTVSSSPRPRWPGVALAGAGYACLSLVVWWNVWSSHPASTTTCGCGDTSLFLWFIEWPAYALAHGLNPLYSTVLFHPTGIDLLSNTSVVAVGIGLAPVTWLFGPVASLNVALFLSPVLSSLAMFILLRRWVHWPVAAFVGGLLYGFSPLVLVNLTNAYLMTALSVVPPLVVICLDELLIRQERSPLIVGFCLGILLTLQFFIGTEALIILLIACAIGTILLLAGAGLLSTGGLGRRVRHVSIGLGSGAVTAGVLLAYPAWFALAGPAHLAGPVWPMTKLGYYGISLKDLVVPSQNSSAYVQLAQRVGGYQGRWLSPEYLGIGAIAVVISGLILWRRDRRLWFFAAMSIVSLVLALGAKKALFLPWQLVAGLPLLQNIIPNRFIVITDLCLTILVGLIVDHTFVAVRDSSRSKKVNSGTGSGRSDEDRPDAKTRPRRFRWMPGLVGALVVMVAIVPTAVYLAETLPITTQPVALPDWYRTVAPRLTSHQVLLSFPVPYSGIQSAMVWQAVDRMHFAMVGGGGPEGIASRDGIERPGEVLLGAATYSEFFNPLVFTPNSLSAIRQSLGQWGVTTVVVPDQSDLPVYDQVTSVPFVVGLMTAVVGRAPIHQADAWVWDGVGAGQRPSTSSTRKLAACTSDPTVLHKEAVVRVIACILGRSATSPTEP